MKTILVTGGAGFIGSNLCEHLLNKNCRVIAVDNLFSGSIKNIEHLSSNPNFLFIKDDIANHFSIEEKVDEIYNLACPASPVWYQKNPVATVHTNVLGTINTLKVAQKKSARILQASTSEIYGDPLEHPQKETYRGNVNTLGPRACYDEGKRCAETLMMDHHRQYGVDVKIIRIFNTYGPKMAENDGRVVSNFIIQALKNKDISIFGDGKQTRSFQYIDDLISGMVLMMEKDDFIGPVNIGNPEEYTMLELAEKIIDLTCSKSKITYHPLPEDDPLKRRPDITLAREKLGWSPKVPLEKGLKKTIEYFKNIITS